MSRVSIRAVFFPEQKNFWGLKIFLLGPRPFFFSGDKGALAHLPRLVPRVSFLRSRFQGFLTNSYDYVTL